MPRRSTRQSLPSTEAKVELISKDVKSERKSSLPALKASQPVKKQNAKKSRYFKTNGDDDATERSSSGDASDPSDEASDFEEESTHDDSASETASELPEEDDYSDEQPKRKRKGSAKTSSKKIVTEVKRGSELWREGVDIGLPPGTQVIIKKPKPRPAGKIPYKDDTIHPNTFLFLTDLKANNDREWMKMHDPDYRIALNDWNTFVGELTQKLVEIDDTIPELPVKDITFRIHRDIRFSSDKTPYKPYFSAAWSRTGRKGPYAHYYVQISPGNNSFIGGGMWHPEAPAIAALRQTIDQNPQRLKDVLKRDDVRQELLNGVVEDEAVQAFVTSPANKETALKTKPKGYDSDHVDIELLRLKNFTVGRKLLDAEILDGNGFLNRAADLCSVIQPFIACLNRIVLPDPGESESEGDEEELRSETSSDTD